MRQKDSPLVGTPVWREAVALREATRAWLADSAARARDEDAH